MKLDLRNFLDLEPVGAVLEDLDTPVPVIDIGIVERNLRKWQARCEASGMANRPHIKTHKLSGLARYQIALGARGITVQKLGEAEAMADAGITDMLLTYNVLGTPKVKRLAALARTPCTKDCLSKQHPCPSQVSMKSPGTALWSCSTR